MSNITYKLLTIRELLDSKKYDTNIINQRTFIYNQKEVESLIDSIYKNTPIPNILLGDKGDGTYEVLDGKQRITGFRIFNDPKHIKGLTMIVFSDHKKEQILDKEILAQIYSGTEAERLNVMEMWNTTAKVFSEFELLNMKYGGLYTKNWIDTIDNMNGDTIEIFGNYNRGKAILNMTDLIRNSKVDTRDKFFRHNKYNSNIEHKQQIDLLVEKTATIFKNYHCDWDKLIYIVRDNPLHWNTWILNSARINELFNHHKKNGDYKIAPSKDSFYRELLDIHEQTNLDSQRFFSKDDKIILYRQDKKCNNCTKSFDFDDLQIDHDIPWSKGGKTILTNARLLCASCNTKKSNSMKGEK